MLNAVPPRARPKRNSAVDRLVSLANAGELDLGRAFSYAEKRDLARRLGLSESSIPQALLKARKQLHLSRGRALRTVQQDWRRWRMVPH